MNQGKGTGPACSALVRRHAPFPGPGRWLSSGRPVPGTRALVVEWTPRSRDPGVGCRVDAPVPGPGHLSSSAGALQPASHAARARLSGQGPPGSRVDPGTVIPRDTCHPWGRGPKSVSLPFPQEGDLGQEQAPSQTGARQQTPWKRDFLTGETCLFALFSVTFAKDFIHF